MTGGLPTPGPTSGALAGGPDTSPADALRATLAPVLSGSSPHPAARDLWLNLQATLLGESALTPRQAYTIAVGSALSAPSPALARTLAALAPPEAVDDGRAAAALMAMNNVYYRFRHVVGKESYQRKPARLRMNRIASPATGKADFELACLAVSAINGCEACVRSHEAAVLAAGLTEDHVHDAVRLAATVRAVGVAMADADALGRVAAG